MADRVCLGEMDSTMMYKVCGLQRLMAENPVSNIEDRPRKVETARICFSESIYDELLTHVKKKNPELLDYRLLPYPAGGKVFLPFGTPTKSVEISSQRASFNISPMDPNNCVMYDKKKGRKGYGLIKQIYRYENPLGGVEEAVLIEPIIEVYGKKVECPSRNFCYSLHLLGCMVGKSKPGITVLLPLTDILATAAYRILPPHTFGLKDGGITLKPVLH